MIRRFKFTCIALMVTAICTVAYAARSLEGDAAAAVDAKVSLAQAVSIAEQHLQGKAVRAALEHARSGWVYDVEVVKSGRAFDVRLDADKGSVLSATIDKLDRDDAHDKRG